MAYAKTYAKKAKPLTEEWVRIPGAVVGVLERSVAYLIDDIGPYRKKVFIPLSQCEVRPREGDKNIVVRGWLAGKNGWRTIPILTKPLDKPK